MEGNVHFSPTSLCLVSNSILLSFDAERAANDASELKRIQAVIVNLNKRVERMESKQL